MYFKVTCQAKPLYLEKDQKIEFIMMDDDESISITLERIPQADLRPNEKDGELRCSAILERSIADTEKEQIEKFKETGENKLNGFILTLEQKLREIAERAIYTYRWYRGIPNAHNPIRCRFGMFYSFNNKDWTPVHGPTKMSLVAKFGPAMRMINADFVSNMQSLVESKAHESIGHVLYAEALELRTSNPRSALLIGIAALETGFKAFVSGLAPDAAWMMENAPSPPLVNMLKNYLPRLPCKLKIKSKVLPPPQELRKIVDKGVQLRNKLAHGGELEIKADDLENLLNAIRDILYLLDYYAGQKWAFSNISVETAQLLAK